MIVAMARLFLTCIDLHPDHTLFLPDFFPPFVRVTWCITPSQPPRFFVRVGRQVGGYVLHHIGMLQLHDCGSLPAPGVWE